MRKLLFILLLCACKCHAASDTLLVHVFTTQVKADSAISVINTGEGIPANDSAITRTFTNAFYDSASEQWYIKSNGVTKTYLGAPIQLIIIKPHP